MAKVGPLFSQQTGQQLEQIKQGVNELVRVLDQLKGTQVDIGSFRQAAQARQQVTAADKEAEAMTKKLLKATRDLEQAQTEEGKQLIQLREQKNQINRETRRQARENVEVTDSYDKLRQKLRAAERAYRNAAAAGNINAKETKELREEVLKLRNQVDDINQPIGRFTDNVGNYKSAVEGLIPGLDRLNGLLDQFGEESQGAANVGPAIKGTFDGITTGIKNATRAALQFVLTPIGAAIAGLAAIGTATAAFFRFNAAVAETNREIENLTNLTGDELDGARVRATALAKVFDVEINDTVKAARGLVEQFGIDFDEAFDVIENGIVKGGEASDEFLDQLREYGTFFASAGFSVQEFQQVVNAGFDLGIYQDKLPDAIKEFDLSIREQTAGTREALVNAFGESFTADLLEGVKTGEISTREALQNIAAETERVGLNTQQAAQLTADLFRGAGEDAGGALQIFKAVNVALGEQARQLNEIEQRNRSELELQKQLEQARSDAFASDEADEFLVALRNLGRFIAIEFFKTLADFRRAVGQAFDGISNFVSPAVNALKDLGISFGDVAAVIRRVFIFALTSALKPFTAIFDGAMKAVNAIRDFIDIIKRIREEGIGAVFVELGQSIRSGVIAQFERLGRIAGSLISILNGDLKGGLQGLQAEFGLLGDEAEQSGRSLDNVLRGIGRSFRRAATNVDTSMDDMVEVIEDGMNRAAAAVSDFEPDPLDERTLAALEEAKQKTAEILGGGDLTELEGYMQRRRERISEDMAETTAMIEEQERERAERLQEIREEQQALRLEASAFGLEQLNVIFGEYFERRSEQYDEDLNRLQETEAAKLEYVDLLLSQGTITAEDAYRRRQRIAEETARQEANIRRQQAVQEKKAALFDIVITTAVNIVKAFGRPVQQALAAATGAVQGAIVASRPIPQFAEGTDDAPGGLALVGEEGPELIQYPDGKWGLASRQMVVDLPKHSQVFTASETTNMMRDPELLNEMKGVRKAVERYKPRIRLVNNVNLGGYETRFK